MILADTSAWVEFLRATGSPVHLALRAALREGALAVADPVLQEVLQGAPANRFDDLLRLLNEQQYLAVAPREDWVDAATLYRSCRQAGVTVRSSTDCLIATVAIRHGLPVLQLDRDFEAIARCSSLTLAR